MDGTTLKCPVLKQVDEQLPFSLLVLLKSVINAHRAQFVQTFGKFWFGKNTDKRLIGLGSQRYEKTFGIRADQALVRLVRQVLSRRPHVLVADGCLRQNHLKYHQRIFGYLPSVTAVITALSFPRQNFVCTTGLF
jgi:hypothetical protein